MPHLHQRKILSLKIRLLLSISTIMIIGLVIGGFVILNNAQEAVEAEITSSFDLAKKLISTTRTSNKKSLKNNVELSNSIHDLRHVQVIVEHKYLNKDEDQNLHVKGVPDWFVYLVYPKKALATKLVIHERIANNISIAADPTDEIKEVWEDVRDLLILTLSLFITSLILIYFSIWHGLKPLKILQEGFEKLEQNQLDIHITENTVPELAQLHSSFNQMVATLRKTTQEKQDLTRKLISLQEDERTHISRELHDEIGPYLFSLRVNNSNLKKKYHADRNNESEIDRYLDAIDKTTEQLQLRIKQLLKKLRPMILNDLSLEEAIIDLMNIFKTSDPKVDWRLNYNLTLEISDTINVTLYRIVQECLTNIGRHAKASLAIVSLSTEQSADEGLFKTEHIILTVEDNGQGIKENTHSGFGLIGIKERVVALGGTFSQSSNPSLTNSGVLIKIIIPAHK